MAKKSSRTKYLVDVIAFVLFLAAMDPRSTGIPLHEWVSIAFAGVVVVHLLLSWRWISAITHRFFGRTTGRARLNYVLNALLFIDGTIIGLSGLMVSQAVLPLLGITMPHSSVWRGLHSLSANLAVVLTGLHVALHWKWIGNKTKQLVLGRLSSKRSQLEREGAGA